MARTAPLGARVRTKTWSVGSDHREPSSREPGRVELVSCPRQGFLIALGGVAYVFLRAVSPFVATSSLDVAYAFSVLCRAFEPDISESIVRSSPGQSATRAVTQFDAAPAPL